MTEGGNPLGRTRMRTGLLVCAIAALASACHGQASYRATVKVTPHVLNTVRPWIFGDNIEWANAGMGFLLPGNGGFDENLVRELKAAGVTNLRYPGGTLSDYFDWKQAIGDARTPQPNPFDKGRTARPDFGPSEFVVLCRRVGIPGMITLNAGTGTPELAAGWVRTCREQRVPVTAFEVGNEIYMADPNNESVPSLPISKTPEQYADFFLRTRALVDKVAPGTRLGAIGLLDTGAFALNRHADWMKTILTRIGGRMDFIAIHNGYAPAVRGSGMGPQARRISDDEFAACLMGASVYVRNNLAATEALIARYAGNAGKRIDIHITEHGPLVYPFDPPHAIEDALWNRSLAGALYQACLFNVMLRDPRVTSANHLPLCQDVYGALIGIRGQGPGRKTWRNIVFHVFRQYARMAGRNVMQVQVACPEYSTRMAGIVPALKAVPCLDAAAYAATNGSRMTLFLINRDLEREAVVDIDASGMRPVSATSLAADSYLAANSPEQPELVAPVAKVGRKQFAGGFVRIPKHSLLIVEFERSVAARAKGR